MSEVANKLPLKVFLCYASQDGPAVQELYNALKADWIDPWLDRVNILPGQEWRTVIEKAVEESDLVIVCLSTRSVSKEGYLQREIKYAYDIALEKPEETIFLIPLRLDDCVIPRGLRHLHWNNYFGPEKDAAFSNLLRALKLRYQQKYGAGQTNDVVREKNAAGNAKAKASISEANDQPNPKRDESAMEPPVQKSGSAKTLPKNKLRQKKSRIDPTVLAALIGVIGTILASVISIYANRGTPAPTPLPTSTVTITATVTETHIPTETSTSGPPTLTSVPATETVPPTASVTPVLPAELGKDWTAGCISTLWQAYPSDIVPVARGDGCWKEPLHVFSAENGDLDFLSERSTGSTETFGLFAPLPEKGTVTFNVRLRELTNVDLWMGIFAEPDITSKGLLLIIPSGDTRNRVIVHKDPQTYENLAATITLAQGPGFSISFNFDTLSAIGRVNPSVFVTNPFSIPTEQKWLFLGYKGLTGYYKVQGSFLKFELKP